MTYASQQDLIDRFGGQELIRLTDRADPPSDAIDADIVTRALEDADADINAYLVRQHSLPLSPVPRLVLNLACDVARYKLHPEHAPEQVEERYKAAIKMLGDLATGKASLGDDDPSAVLPAESSGPQVNAPERTFSRDTLEGY
ncbi:DUF1320 domain-containing protein [Parvibaculaceae bacterium PLY_AMNH_Bact1]|nr:DUF1320 domain-containing protein [Parvibaculaceae bacterium PLY_AMNH_Bact1]